MLHSAIGLKDFTVSGVDGEVGAVEDVYFDDERWVVRYIVVDTGGWLTGRAVLLPPLSFRQADWDGGTLLVNLTRDKIESSPGIEAHMPVSRQQESELFRYYDYPYYWAGPYPWGFSMTPMPLAEVDAQARAVASSSSAGREDGGEDIRLRSCNEVKGYAIHASDATLGHVEDFLFDEEDWSIQQIVVDPRNWWPGAHVLVPPQRIVSVNWEDGSVTVGMTRSEVEHSPAYDPDHPPLPQPHGGVHGGRQPDA